MKTWIPVAMAAMMGVALVAGCSDSDDKDGTFSGTWTGTACGRGLTLTLVQDGQSLTGTYALTDPDFGPESVRGTLSRTDAPATVELVGRAGRTFQLDFSSFNSVSGGFYKDGVLVCEVRARK